MSVLVYIESDEGVLKKSSFEAAAFASGIAEASGQDTIAVAFHQLSDEDLKGLGKYGVNKVLKVPATDEQIKIPQVVVEAISKAAEETGAKEIVISNSTVGEAASSRVAIRLGAALATNVIELPDLSDGFIVKRSIYTGKAFGKVKLSADKKILTVKKNAIALEEKEGSAEIVDFDIKSGDVKTVMNITAEHKVEGDVLLPEAELVVSGGRGLKGPENWGMIEELAKKLGAATACSKPVSDADWRPHHEHVGQTGIKISPNLYIAIAISGAIQHLAGVSSSKVIVVINTDPEAPFFKAADYGIVGDAFDVVPKLTEEIGKLN